MDRHPSIVTDITCNLPRPIESRSIDSRDRSSDRVELSTLARAPCAASIDCVHRLPPSRISTPAGKCPDPPHDHLLSTSKPASARTACVFVSLHQHRRGCIVARRTRCTAEGARGCVILCRMRQRMARSPCRHFKIQSCCCLGSAFKVAASQTMRER